MIRSLLLALLLLCGQGFASKEAPASAAPPHTQEVLAYAEKHLTLQGVLKKTASGFVYVDVDDDYIHKLAPLIREEGFEEPPYFDFEDAVGAHISVVYSEELAKYPIGEIEECGTLVSFTLNGCLIVHPHSFEGVEEVYIIQVESPYLDALRKKYGMPIREYPFHITIGVKRANTRAA